MLAKTVLYLSVQSTAGLLITIGPVAVQTALYVPHTTTFLTDRPPLLLISLLRWEAMVEHQ